MPTTPFIILIALVGLIVLTTGIIKKVIGIIITGVILLAIAAGVYYLLSQALPNI